MNINVNTGKKSNSRTKSDGFLNEDELTYWSVHYKVDEGEIHNLPDIPSTFISLKKTKVNLLSNTTSCYIKCIIFL